MKKKIAAVPLKAAIKGTAASDPFRMLLEIGQQGLLVTDARGRIIYASPASERILGYRLGEGSSIIRLPHQDDLEMLRLPLSEMFANPGVQVDLPPFRVRHGEGGYRRIRSTASNMLGNPSVAGIVHSFRDVTQEFAVHQNLTYANRLYDLLRQVNQAIVHVTDEGALFAEACRIAVEHGGFRFAWTGIPDRATGKVPMIASAGGCARDLDFFKDYSYDPQGPIAQVLANMCHYVVDHIQSRKNQKFISYANERGFQSAIVLPVLKSGEVFAVLSLYAAGKSFFHSAEVALLAEVSRDLSFALDVFERDRLRLQAEQELKLKERRLSQAQEVANVGSWDFDFATGVSRFSEQALRIYGLDTHQPGQSYEKWLSYLHPDDKRRVLKTIRKAEKTLGDCAFYHRIVRPDGSIRAVHSKSHFEFDEGGIPKGLTGVVHDITEMRDHEHALRASEDAFRRSESRYRQIVENAHEGIWLLDMQDRTIFANGKMCRILGYSYPEMLGADFRSFTAEGSGPDSIPPQGAQVQFRTKSGRLIWANVALGPVIDDSRLALVADITENKELEGLLHSATTMARIGAYEFDVESGTMFWSPMTRSIHGVDESFVPTLENSIAFYKEGDSRDAIKSAGMLALKQNIPWDLELQIVTQDGSHRWVRVIGEPEHRQGRCIRIRGSFQDIDSRKRAELEVLEIAQEKNVILESIGNAFFAVDTQWNITYWNREAERLLGMKRADAIGRNLWDLYPETIGTDYYTRYHKAIEDGVVQQFETLYEPIQMWTEVSAYPSVSGLSIYFKDITERKEAEAERSAMMSEIIRRNQDLEQFSYIVSHNLRGPLANIIGIAGALQDGMDEEMTSQLREGISVSAERLDQVLRDLNGILQLGKEVSESRERICLAALVEEIRESIIDLLRSENVAITADFKVVGELISIKSYLHSIFYNLIANSIKYRRHDAAPVIRIASERHGKRAAITFSDNGLGIDLEKKRDQVFGLYRRFHDHVEGRGLGLFMVKTQVEMLGGSVSIESEVGRGTAFTIHLPI